MVIISKVSAAPFYVHYLHLQSLVMSMTQYCEIGLVAIFWRFSSCGHMILHIKVQKPPFRTIMKIPLED